MATQNPIESEGTYPLPEAQVDRFMLKVLVGYPTPTEEFVVVERMIGTLAATAAGARRRDAAWSCQRAADAVYVDPALIEYAVRLASATRDPASSGLRRPGPLRHLRRQPARLDQPGPRGQGARLPPRPRLRAAARRARPRPRRAAPPASCCPTRRSPTTSAPTTSSRPILAAVPVPEVPLRERPQPARCRSTDRRRPASDPTLTPERLLRRLEWRVVRRLDGQLQGDYRTLFRGAGIDFTDLREYEPGDDVRHIDWNVTARLDTPYVRKYIEDRELTAWLLLDRSASMGFGPADRQKERRAHRGRDDARAAC